MSHDATPEENVAEVKPEVSKDLQDKLQALKSLVGIDRLLETGKFSGTMAHEIVRGRDFIAALHAQLLAEVLEHPDADKVEELKAFKKPE